MDARVTMRDDQGRPVRVEMDDGFCLLSGPYVESEHGWIEEQLDPRSFPLIAAGRQMEGLVHEINRLRRENWRLEQQNKLWTKAAGY